MRIWSCLLLAACVTNETESTTAQELGAVVELRTYWGASSGDYATTTVAPSGYVYYRTEGRIFSPSAAQPLDTLPLNTWYGAARGDYLTTTNPYWANGSPGELRNNYTFVRKEGYVFANPVAGTLAMQGWWNATNADNYTTTDPRYTVDAAHPHGGYNFVRAEGYLFTPTTEQLPAQKESFRWGEMGGAPRGERDLLVLLVDFADEPMHHTNAQFDALAFGPSFPNVRDYTSRTSQNRFTWRRGGVLGPFQYPDDPQTSADESLFNVMFQDGTSNTIALGLLETHAGRYINATNPATTAGDDISTATFSFHDLNGGALEADDYVALKSLDGLWLREYGGRLYFDSPTITAAARFRVGGTGPIVNGSYITLQTWMGTYVSESSDGTLRASSLSSGSPTLHVIQAFAPDHDRLLRTAIAGARANGYDFSIHDHDGNGVVDADELDVIVLHSGPFWDLAQSTVVAAVPGSPLAQRFTTSAGEDLSFMTFVHELHHHLGAVDTREDHANWALTTMSDTRSGRVDDRRSWLLDPWHRIRLGWVEPITYALGPAGGSSVLLSPMYNSARPVLLYDPRRYNTSTKTGEYFLVEFRSNRLGGYDQDTARPGLAIWQVADGPTNEDIRLFHLSPIGLGQSQLWTASDGTASLMYNDGTDSGLRVRTAAISDGSAAVEWTDGDALVPRLDGGTTSATPGTSITIDGMLPVAASNARFYNTWTGATVTLAPSTWSPSRATFALPASLGTGAYKVTIDASNTQWLHVDP